MAGPDGPVRVPGRDPQGHGHDNAIESVSRVALKFTRNRKPSPKAASALTGVFLAIHAASKTWTMPIVGWKAALNHFAIAFEGRIPSRAMT